MFVFAKSDEQEVNVLAKCDVHEILPGKKKQNMKMNINVRLVVRPLSDYFFGICLAMTVTNEIEVKESDFCVTTQESFRQRVENNSKKLQN